MKSAMDLARIIGTATVACGLLAAAIPAVAQDYDVVILNGRVMDPETRYDATANVGIKVQVGMDADIVVFEPETIADKATYEDANQPAVGVQTVLVNGVAVVAGGELILDENPGRPIRRTVQAR
jgi:N-acyl-D-glutamate deacylase